MTSFALLAWVALVLLPVGISSAQTPEWFQQNNKGSRYEGFLDRPNASTSFTVLGFFAYRENRDLLPSDVLHIEYFVPPGDQRNKPADEPVSIRAQEIHGRSEYIMEPHLEALQATAGGWRTFDGWPVRDVLLPNHVPLSNLAVLIHLKGGNGLSEQLAPALLYTEPGKHEIHNYTLYLNLNRALSSLHYTVSSTDEKGAHGQPWNCAFDPGTESVCTEKGTQTAGFVEQGIVRLRFSADHLPVGPITIHLAGEYANSSEHLQDDLHFFNPGLNP